MQKNLNNSYQEVEDFFNSPNNVNQEAWAFTHNFYHIILTQMKLKNMSKADLAKKLNKSRAYVSQLFNQSQNISAKKMAELAYAVGIKLSLEVDTIQSTLSIEISNELKIDMSGKLKSTSSYSYNYELPISDDKKTSRVNELEYTIQS